VPTGKPESKALVKLRAERERAVARRRINEKVILFMARIMATHTVLVNTHIHVIHGPGTIIRAAKPGIPRAGRDDQGGKGS
jgi:hypothetical protein